MNIEQQDKRWERLSDNEQAKWREDYKFNMDNGNEESVRMIEDLFGKENLQPKPKIKVWSDVEELYPVMGKNFYHIGGNFISDEKLVKKLKATYAIAKLIELGYGGMVTEEEWKDEELIKFGVKWNYRANDWVYHNTNTTKEFITFHTPEQREEFMSYPENRKLVEQYYML